MWMWICLPGCTFYCSWVAVHLRFSVFCLLMVISLGDRGGRIFLIFLEQLSYQELRVIQDKTEADSSVVNSPPLATTPAQPKPSVPTPARPLGWCSIWIQNQPSLQKHDSDFPRARESNGITDSLGYNFQLYYFILFNRCIWGPILSGTFHMLKYSLQLMNQSFTYNLFITYQVAFSHVDHLQGWEAHYSLR